MKPILVTCYVNPDLDGVAGALTYAELLNKTGRDAIAGVIGEIHDEAKYVFERFGIKPPIAIENDDGFDEVILVDSSDLIGLEGRIAPEKVIEIIDHRQVHSADQFPNAKTQIELVGAAVTLIAERFTRDAVEISKDAAILLYSAIISNTLNFKGSVTTERDKTAAARLNKTADLDENYWKELFTAKSDLSGDKLEERMGLDFVFLNLIELEGAKNYFVTREKETKKLLEKTLDVRFDGDVAERPDVIMRKQIVPLLKAALTAG